MKSIPDRHDPINPGQFWKIEENNLISMSNDAILGIHQDEGLVAYIGNNPMISPIKVDTTHFDIDRPPVPGISLLHIIMVPIFFGH